MITTSKKVFISLIAAFLFVGLLAGCSNNDNASNASNEMNGSNAANSGDSNQTDSDQAKENDEERALRLFLGVIGGKTPEETELFGKEIERLTGVKVEIEKPASDTEQKLAAAISSGESFDIIQVSKSRMSLFIEQGILTPLTEQVESSEVLMDPDVLPTEEWEQVRAADGQIYGVFDKFQGGTMPIIREDWLKKLGLKEPTTLDEYYTVMKAFVEQDPDGNNKDDTYGLSTSGLYDVQGFFSAAGLKQRYVEKDGKLIVPYATDEAIPIYEWLNKLYREGILDPNFATNSTSQMRDLFLTDRVGVITYWDAWVGMLNNTRLQADPNTEFVAKGLPGVADKDGNYLLRRGDPSVFVIPVNAEHPKTAFEFIEWWHSKDGIYLGAFGIKDHDWKENNGTIELTDIGKEHNMDHGVPFWYNKKVENPFGLLPGVAEAQELILKYGGLELTPLGWPDAEKIINDYSFKAIMGDIPAADAVKKMREELQAKKLMD